MSSSPLDAPRAANRRGVLAMVAGMASFVTNDTLVKYVSESLPGPQLIFIRGLCATLLVLALVHATGAGRQLRDVFDRKVLLRSGLDAFATMAYLTSLFHLPLGNATAINMATPLFITLFAVIGWREHVGVGRWLAIATGFTGVLLVVQPAAAAFNAWSLLCLAGTLLHAGRDLSTRFIDKRIPSLVITLGTAIAVTLLSGLWTLASGWRPVSAGQFGLLAAASVFLSGGYFFLTVSMRAGDISFIAPFRYAGLLYALFLGWLVWGDVPNAMAWGGIALLVGAGLYVLRGR